MISAMGLPVTMTTKKLSEGHPNVTDVINDGSVGAVINTLSGVSDVLRDGFYIRRAAVERQIPCFTSLDTARAAVESLLAGGAAYSIGTTREYLDGG
jgi:carbamoyl-phosphate synthase large subunit